MGMDVSNGKWFKKVRYALNMVSILVTWALENAIETADSMKSRGYGLKGRTAFSIYRFNRRDKILGGMLAVLLWFPDTDVVMALLFPNIIQESFWQGLLFSDVS